MDERRCRFVQGEVVRLPIAGNEWIDVKAELNAGEQRRVFSSLVKEMNAGEPARLDPDRVGLTRILAYVVGWSLLNADGRPERFDEAAVDNLDVATYRDIIVAVDAHDAACEERRDARKKNLSGEAPLSPTSGLPSVVDGTSKTYAA